MIAAVLIGIAFGFALERAGLGSARKLTGQFYGTDFTVFKVMFSAILTAMLFAARTLGHDVLLYDGSFEDWSRQPDAPVETTR